MRTTCSNDETKIFPSPIFPVRAAASTASMTRSTMASSTAASIFTLGRKSTTYSAPRYSSVWPFWRPKPFTSVTVTPCTPMALRASRTSSSLNGLTMAVTIFMVISRLLGEGSEGLLDSEDQAAASQVLARGRRVGEHCGRIVLGVGADDGAAPGEAGGVLAHGERIVGVGTVAPALDLLVTQV